VLHRHAVVVRGGQAQVLEDRPGVAQAVLVPGGEEGNGFKGDISYHQEGSVISCYKLFGKSTSSVITSGRLST
jgi:hypothetical protein